MKFPAFDKRGHDAETYLQQAEFSLTITRRSADPFI
jgi:hypothetical protein